MVVISSCSTFNVTLYGSHEYSKRAFDDVLDILYMRYPMSFVLQTRDRVSLKREWAVHNLLYNLGLWRARTRNVDFNSPLSFCARVGYDLFGRLSMLFIK